MSTRVTPKPMVSLGKVWSFDLFDLHVTQHTRLLLLFFIVAVAAAAVVAA